ncbi:MULTISPECIES: hypothetical protein [unclassified Serratia (in: enterobacteria)]|uniref:hypothetical protein n=1 Tax=unclassified Serratia (in: enterobacteria) TaxID=2647522 RepID=UPI0018AAA3D9|nr:MULTISPECIES: hypothetical protein [unclassified Serratia (in: enterobacteria)]
MTSLPAGSPKCNCKNPDTCIHSLTLTIDKRVYEYKQGDFISLVSVINKTANPLPLKLSLVGKSCVSHNPECPKGLIYSPEQGRTLKTFTRGSTSYDVNYDTEQTHNLAKIDSVEFISRYILNQGAVDWLPKSQYILRVGQCQGQPFVEKKLNFADGFKQLYNIAPSDRLWTVISVYPNYTWVINLTIAASEKVIEYSETELKAERRRQNSEAGMSQRGTRGWTTLSKYSITDTLEAEGKLSYKLGQEDEYSFSQNLKANFTKRAKELTILQDTMKAMDVVGKALSTGEGTGTKYKILDAEIMFPKLVISGGGELTEDDKTHQVYMKGKVSVSLKPLVGLQIKLDLLQAFAAWYGVASVTDIIRQQLAARENSVMSGKNGAYAGLEFNLIAYVKAFITLAFESNVHKTWNWRVDGTNEVELELSLKANARAGVKFYCFEGAFVVEGTGTAVGIIAFDRTPQDRIEMIFYHKGIKVEVGASYSVGVAVDNKDKNGANGSGRSAPSSVSKDIQAKKSQGVNKEWIIHDELEKKNSTYRCVLL